MANSDNVLRGGLTPKHVDVPELLRTLTFRAGRPPLLRPREVAPGLGVYDTPVAEFQLSVLRPRPGRPVECADRDSAEILLCTEGGVELVAAGHREPVALPRGAAAFVPAAVQGYRVEGAGVVFGTAVPR
jgi:mannose-6-phosphate isomerase